MPQWTLPQQRVIDHKDGTLLVSAAAGSGKTAVLVAHVLARLTDPHDPIDIDRLIIVTFTNAAAAELRTRIGQALQDEVMRRPDDMRLRRQLFLVHRARISTVHTLCKTLIAEQASVLGLPSNFRLIDENEQAMLHLDALEEVIERAYAAVYDHRTQHADPTPAPLEVLLDHMSEGGRDDGLDALILRLYRSIVTHPNPLGFVEHMDRTLQSDQTDTPYHHILWEQGRQAIAYGRQILARAAQMCTVDEKLQKTYLKALQSDQAQAEELAALLRGECDANWDALVDYLGRYQAARLTAPRGYPDKGYLEKIKALRKLWKEKVLAKGLMLWFCKTGAQIFDERQASISALQSLLALVRDFYLTYGKRKRARGVLDFNDLEHDALALLYQQDGTRTPFARALGQSIAEILVDEYQDTNAVQEAIFTALSQEGQNLFYVGDLKQSIYGFRSADPTIFLEKYHRFAEVEHAQRGQPRRIVLGKNFRSRETVLDACNYLFSRIMSPWVGDLAYTDREALYAGAVYPEPHHPRYRTELVLVDTAQAAEAPEDSEQEDSDALTCEAQVAAIRLRALLDEGFLVTDKQSGQLRPVTPDDMVILLRSHNSRAQAFVDALATQGIAAVADRKSGLLASDEVRTMVSLLFVLDNPYNEIELIGVLHSPLYGFTENELAQIRLCLPEGNYYDALQAASATHPKAAAFVAQLNELCALAVDLPVYRLLGEIFDRTGALGLYSAMPEGQQRQANLLAFFERARHFEVNGFRGLFAFVRMLRHMLDNGQDFAANTGARTDGVVRIMSIHASKGLEFAVVLLAGCGTRFNDSDLKEPIVLHDKLGLAARYIDRTHKVRYPSFEYKAIGVQLRHQTISEEMRLFYVAMTRAKEKLILLGASKSIQTTLQNADMLAEFTPLPPYAMGMKTNLLDWILPTLVRTPCTRALREAYGVEVAHEVGGEDVFEVYCISPLASEMHTDGWVTAAAQAEDTACTASEAVPQTAMPAHETTALCAEETTLTVPPPLVRARDVLCNLPSKVTATMLAHGFRGQETQQEAVCPLPNPLTDEHAHAFDKGQMASQSAAEGTRGQAPQMWVTQQPWQQVSALRVPRFLESERTLTPAEVGTAHHLFLQFCDFAVCQTPGGVQSELARMRAGQILSPLQADAILPDKLEQFFKSDLFCTHLAHGQVRREFKFSVLVPASTYYPEAAPWQDECVLLQGVIDCLVYTPQGFLIVDFKTDRVGRRAIAARAAAYRPQLMVYRRAVAEVFGQPIAACLLHFLYANQTVEVKDEPLHTNDMCPR